MLLVAGVLLLTAAGFASAHWRSFVPLVSAALGLAVLWGVRLHLQPLQKVRPQPMTALSKAEGVGWLVALLTGVLR